MGIGYKIKELAGLKEINLKELSRKADVSYNTLYAIVQRDNESVRPDILIKIAKALEVPIWELYGVSPEDDEVESGNKILDQAFKVAKDNLKKEIPDKQLLEQVISKVKKDYIYTYEEVIISNLNGLNEDGKKEALKRINELSQLEQYREEND